MEKSCLFFIAFTMLFKLSLSQTLPLNTSNTDQEALIAFRNSIISDPFKILAKNWSTNTSACNWIGVFCNRDQRVTSLNISGFDLGGTVSPSLGNLTYLTSLGLGSNYFTGFLPHELSNLRRLKEIHLVYNALTGEIPSWLGTLPELEVISLNNNNFSGKIPSSLSNNTRLRVLTAPYNSLTGSIPQEVGNMSLLQRLDLKYNKLTGMIPYGIFNLSGLERLDLTVNSLSGVLRKDMCDNVPRITGLFLSHNLLSGQIPFSIYKCRNLQDLSLSINHFDGIIPSSIGLLIDLRTLYLGVNNFIPGEEIPVDLGNLTNLEILSIPGTSVTGEIPSFIFNMSSLRVIVLTNNTLSGSIQMPAYLNLPNLEQLFLDSNELSGQISVDAWNFEKLWVLSLSNNNLSGGIPRKLVNLTSLQYLYLDNNKFTGELLADIGNLDLVEMNVADNVLSGPIPLSIFNISTIKMLELSGNSFSGKLPSNVGHSIPSLEKLFLSTNNLGGVIPSSITNASNLELLEFGDNSFTGSIPNLGELKSLKRLLLRSNNLTGDLRFLSSLTRCRDIELIEVSMNPLNGILPTSVGNFSDSLRVFKAFDCGIRSSIPSGIGNLTGLRDLYLDNNEFTGSIPRTLGNLKELVRLYLEHNKLEGNIPGDMCKLSNLGDLCLSGNMLSGAIPKCFGEFKYMRGLSLDSNLLESNIPTSLWNLDDLLTLNLSTNMLSGSLTSEIGNLRNVGELDLSWNQFVGNIPSSIDKMEALAVLSLEHNFFEGNIPESLGNLRALESLDISYNNLSGSIPDSLTRIVYLRYFNVSYNRLQGQIPKGGSFANFTAQSFLNNYGLCGDSHLQVPSCEENQKTKQRLILYISIPCILAVITVTSVLVLMRRTKSKKDQPVIESSLLHSWKGSSYFELSRATNGFDKSNILGSGSFGTVYKGTLLDGLTVAIKVFDLNSETLAKSLETEIEVLRNIRHRNLIRIIGCCINPDFKALVYEYMPNGSLEKWLYSHNYFLNLLRRMNIAIDVASALEYLHVGLDSPVIHRDLNPSNVLLDEDMTAKVGDFGIAKHFDHGEFMTQTETLATIGYMAPEYGAQGIVSTSSNIYSFGIILLEMFTRKKPTDEIFGDGMSLKNWVTVALMTNDITEVADTNLLGRSEEDANFSSTEKCISSVFGLAMECLKVLPLDRIVITEVVAKLKKIRATFVAATPP